MASRAVRAIWLTMMSLTLLDCGGKADPAEPGEVGGQAPIGGRNTGGRMAAGGDIALPTVAGGSLAGGVGGTAAVGTGGVDISASQCSTIGNLAPTIMTSIIAQDPPTPTGGTILDGTYYLTARVLYTGEGSTTSITPTSIQETIVISSSSTDSAVMQAMLGQPMGEMAIRYQWSQTLALDGVTYRATVTCRTYYLSVSDSSGFYSATPEELQLFEVGTNLTSVQIYTRQ